MEFKRRRALKRTKIEIIPTIDTMFFLLVFFMLSSLALVRLQGLPVNLPQASTAKKQTATDVTITIDRQQRVYVNKEQVSDADLGRQGLILYHFPLPQRLDRCRVVAQRREHFVGVLAQLGRRRGDRCRRAREPDRLVVTCRYFLDLSEAETAGVLGIARGTVKSRLSRALARLGPIIRDLGPLVVIPPAVGFPSSVVQHVGYASGASAKGLAASALGKLRSNAQHVATLGSAAE